MEIERKFLVKDILGIDLSKYSRKQIVQDYLYKDLYTIIRKRKIIKDDNEIYKYTIKTDKNGVAVNEIEKEITNADMATMTVDSIFEIISKYN